MELDKISSEYFRPLVNQRIEVQFTHDNKLIAEVIELSELGGYSPLERKPFSVVIRTDQKNEYYNQGIFGFHHPTFGEIPIFFTPLGFDGIGMKYEAVFS